MIIDDEPAVRDGMETMLGQNGCTIQAAASVAEARRLVIETDENPDVMAADYQLQHGETGIQAVQAIREEINEDVPAVLVTGDTSPDRLDEARRVGLSLLHKPVGQTELLNAIHASLASMPDGSHPRSTSH